MSRLVPLLASLRIANAPSVVSNVTLGYLLGHFYCGNRTSVWEPLALLAGAALCLLFAGNLANDWFDREWDAKHRPERALPSDTFSPRTYLNAAIALAVAAVFLVTSLGAAALITTVVILGLIALYTWKHKQVRWAVVPMGLCRAGLYVLGFAAAWPSDLRVAIDEAAAYAPDTVRLVDVMLAGGFLATHAAGLFVYVVGLSLCARNESLDTPSAGGGFLARALLVLPVAALSAWWVPHLPLQGVAGMLPFLLWIALALTRFRRPLPRLVSALLAGIPLVDLVAAVPLAAGFLARAPGLAIPGEAALPYLAAGLPIAAFLAGLALQRLAPAT